MMLWKAKQMFELHVSLVDVVGTAVMFAVADDEEVVFSFSATLLAVFGGDVESSDAESPNGKASGVYITLSTGLSSDIVE
jgi:hypothetical protein